MKKPHISPLVLVTCICAAFTLGFFVGRNQNHQSVEVNIPQTTAAIPESSAPAADTSQEATSPSETTAETAATEESTPSQETSGRININTATHAELVTLPGIGDVLAQRIIDYRTQNGSFQSVEELLNVSGIGEKKLEAIIDLVTVGG